MSATAHQRASWVAFAALGFVVQAAIASIAGCVDGVTPNCDDAACAPSMGELPHDASSDQASPDTGSAPPDAGSDGASDASHDADGG